MRVRGRPLIDGHTLHNDKTVLIEESRIAALRDSNGDSHQAPELEGWVTPAFIDPHSHIGMVRDGEPASEEESNDRLDQILTLNDPLNSVYFDDSAPLRLRRFRRALLVHLAGKRRPPGRTGDGDPQFLREPE